MRSFDSSQVPETTSDVLFPSVDAPVDLEIGCGVGLHPIRYAQRHPQRVLIAIERTKTRFSRFESRLRGHPGVANIVPVHDDAVRWITHRVPEDSVDRIFLLYPNPYPKARQQNKRWHNMPFMGRLLSCLKPGGSILLATNIQSYAKEATDVMVESWGVELKDEHVYRPGDLPDGGARTHFEKKYLARGLRCFELRFQTKRAACATLG